MKNKWILMAVAAGLLAGCHAKPAGETYISDRLHFSIQLPAMLQIVKPKSTSIHTPSDSDVEFMLLTARQGNEPYGMIMFAQKLNAGNFAIATGADFISRVEKTWGGAQSLGESHFKNDQGIAFDEVDYKYGTDYEAAVVATLGDYLVVTRCNAKSLDDLHAMVAALKEMKKTA